MPRVVCVTGPMPFQPFDIMLLTQKQTLRAMIASVIHEVDWTLGSRFKVQAG
jgi:hypothetical protein